MSEPLPPVPHLTAERLLTAVEKVCTAHWVQSESAVMNMVALDAEFRDVVVQVQNTGEMLRVTARWQNPADDAALPGLLRAVNEINATSTTPLAVVRRDPESGRYRTSTNWTIWWGEGVTDDQLEHHLRMALDAAVDALYALEERFPDPFLPEEAERRRAEEAAEEERRKAALAGIDAMLAEIDTHLKTPGSGQ